MITLGCVVWGVGFLFYLGYFIERKLGNIVPAVIISLVWPIVLVVALGMLTAQKVKEREEKKSQREQLQSERNRP